MNKPRQFVPLLKQMLGFYRYGPLPLLIYLALAAAVLVVSSIFLPLGWMEAHGRQGFWGDQLVVVGSVWWCFLMIVSTPLPFLVLGGVTSLEFLFTRAVDRALWLRTERTAVIIIGLGPLLLNLLLSPLGPKLAFEPAASGTSAARVQQRYIEAFPGSHLTATEPSIRSEQLVIARGSEMFAGWLVWFGLVCLFLVGGYFALVFPAWQRAGWHHSRSRLRPWLGGLMVNGPAFVPIFLLVLCAALHLNFLEESFLLFARHPVVMVAALVGLIAIVQPLSERSIRQLEFEFV